MNYDHEYSRLCRQMANTNNRVCCWPFSQCHLVTGSLFCSLLSGIMRSIRIGVRNIWWKKYRFWILNICVVSKCARGLSFTYSLPRLLFLQLLADIGQHLKISRSHFIRQSYLLLGNLQFVLGITRLRNLKIAKIYCSLSQHVHTSPQSLNTGQKRERGIIKASYMDRLNSS